MGDTVIKVENLGKKYLIRHQLPAGQATLKDYLVDGAKALGQRIRHLGGKPSSEVETSREEFWALKDVSFEVKQGDRVGIIGHNGAGKSTLLKILSRITEPTIGEVTITGRISSLLEVGTGFHPELTGRENIYLNGAILGMGRNEIKNRFDEIVEFSEVEQFLDTPVKRYSSGMYVRLAFAVAAHLESEILIIDEVLAVGDTQFQKKCLGKMDDVAKTGKTILFVSHNMGIIQLLCNRGIFLNKGTVITDSSSTNAVTIYLQHFEKISTQSLSERSDRIGGGKVRFTHIEVTTGEDNKITTLATGRPAYFIFYISEVIPNLSCAFTIYNHLGQPVTYFDSAIHGLEDQIDSENGNKFICKIDELLLIHGNYRINASLMCNGDYEDDVKAAIYFDVDQGRIRGRPVANETGYGSILIQHSWTKPI